MKNARRERGSALNKNANETTLARTHLRLGAGADGRSLFVYVVISIWGTNSNGHTNEEEEPATAYTHTLYRASARIFSTLRVPVYMYVCGFNFI